VISGVFLPGTGLPAVRVNAWLFDIDARLDIRLIVDITVPRTVLSTFDLSALRTLARRPPTAQVKPGDEPDPRVILSLTHEDGHVSGFLLECAVTDADYSCLGRDVMERTVMVYDPRGGNLLLDVLEADL
jgi:hypothetical protein